MFLLLNKRIESQGSLFIDGIEGASKHLAFDAAIR